MLKVLLILLFPTCLAGQDFINIECKSNGKTISINQNYIHIESKPIIRVNCICVNIADPESILSYEWHSRLYKYSFDVVSSINLILIAYEPKLGNPVRVWEISSIKMKILDYVAKK